MTYSSSAFGVVEPTPKNALPKILRISQLGTEEQIPSPAVAAQNAYIQTTENLGLWPYRHGYDGTAATGNSRGFLNVRSVEHGHRRYDRLPALAAVFETFLAPFPHHRAAFMLPSATVQSRGSWHAAGTRNAAKNHPRMDVASEGQATD
jgi:hypothetical protein